MQVVVTCNIVCVFEACFGQYLAGNKIFYHLSRALSSGLKTIVSAGIDPGYLG